MEAGSAMRERMIRYHLPVLLALVLTAFVAYLILTNHLAARQWRDALDGQAEREAGQQARSLESFIAGQLESVADLAASADVGAYHENRALGMSLEYGLRLSLMTIAERFDDVRKRKRTGERASFTRLRLIDETGATLVESPASALPESLPPGFMAVGDDKQVTLSQDHRCLLVSATVRHRGNRVGRVIAWIGVDLLEHFIGTGTQPHLVTFLSTQEAPMIPLAGDEAWVRNVPRRDGVLTPLGQRLEWNDDGHRHVLIMMPVAKSPLLVVTRRSSDRYFGSEPWQSLVMMTVLSVALLGGSIALVRHMARTRRLGALVSEMQVREQVESERNRITLDREVEARRRAEEERAQLGYAVEQAAESIIITDLNGVILYVNRAFTTITGWSRAEALGKTPRILKSGIHDHGFYRDLWEQLRTGRSWVGRLTNRRRDGTLFHEDATISPVRDADGTIQRFLAVKRDVTQLVQMEAQLQQAQKLESIGQLASGIAHEINTPIQFVSDNLSFLNSSFEQLEPVLAELRRLMTTSDPHWMALETLRQNAENSDLSYAHDEIPRSLMQSREGVDRVAQIVQAMKDFSNPGVQQVAPTNLNAAITSTVTVSRNEWRYGAEVDLRLDPHLPLVPLVVGDFNQVLLHLIVNAAHAIDERRQRDSIAELGRILITTVVKGDEVEVQISDNGCGIPEAVKRHIFEPFFTTKPVGQGTGQGLAFARSVIVKKLGGTITFTSTVGVGTTFMIRLPHV